jgi:hypothetical protein
MSISGLSRLPNLPTTIGAISANAGARASLADSAYRQVMRHLSDPSGRVDAYNVHMHHITSVHTKVNEAMDWVSLSALPDPPEPPPVRTKTERAQASLDSFAPSLMDYVFFRAERLRNDLEIAVDKATVADAQANDANRKQWETEMSQANRIRSLAKAVLAGDERAWKHVIENVDPLGALSGIAQSANVEWESTEHADITLLLTTEDVVPEMVLSLTKRGLLSEKAMAQKKRWEIYEDVICGAAIRAAREIFHALPFKSVAVHCTTAGIDSETGHNADLTVLSVHYPRAEFLALGFDRLDPSDSLRRFKHNKDFKRGEGFRPVDRVRAADDITAR